MLDDTDMCVPHPLHVFRVTRAVRMLRSCVTILSLVLLRTLQRLPLTCAFEGFFCLFKPEFSWMSINCFHGFPRALTEKVPSSLNEGPINSNDDGFVNCFI